LHYTHSVSVSSAEMMLARFTMSGSLALRGIALTRPQTGRVLQLRSSSQELARSEMKAFWARNQKLGRPVSPHLTVYKWQLTMLMSITHRMTGVFNATLFTSFGVASLFMGDFRKAIERVRALGIPSWLIVLVKFELAFSLFYHVCNGVRHLSWDFLRRLQISQVYSSGYVVVALATLLALAGTFAPV